jgi:hypothetical protein
LFAPLRIGLLTPNRWVQHLLFSVFGSVHAPSPLSLSLSTRPRDAKRATLPAPRETKNQLVSSEPSSPERHREQHDQIVAHRDRKHMDKPVVTLQVLVQGKHIMLVHPVNQRMYGVSPSTPNLPKHESKRCCIRVAGSMVRCRHGASTNLIF